MTPKTDLGNLINEVNSLYEEVVSIFKDLLVELSFVVSGRNRSVSRRIFLLINHSILIAALM